jgi:hypothetical protein
LATGEMTPRAQLRKRIDAIEGAYEYFLAYAAQGLRNAEDGSRVVGQFRERIDAMAEAARGLESLIGQLLEDETVHGVDQVRVLGKVIGEDAIRASAVIEAVRAQPFATSQLVDNLNASIHVRMLLTDLFVLDELLGLDVDKSESARAPEPAQQA